MSAMTRLKGEVKFLFERGGGEGMHLLQQSAGLLYHFIFEEKSEVDGIVFIHNNPF
jgi:hypothetical protein